MRMVKIETPKSLIQLRKDQQMKIMIKVGLKAPVGIRESCRVF
jgi:hypothetical protein